MDHIPDEVLLMILEYLPTHVLCMIASQVCRRWARLVGTRAALVSSARSFRRWSEGRGVRALLLAADEPVITPGFSQLNSAAYLTELTIDLGLALSTTELLTLADLRLNHVDFFCVAEVLNMTAVPLSSNVSSLVINEPICSSYLKSLTLNTRLKSMHMYGRAGCYPREELVELINSHFKRFEELTLRCPTLKESDYITIGKCTTLRSLKLYCCWEITLPSALAIVALQQLQILHLTGICKYLDSLALHRVVSKLPPGLVELSLSASRLHDEHVAALTRRSPRLRRIELWRTHLSPCALVRLARSLPQLQELDVDTSLPRRLILALAQHPNLVTLRCQLPKEKIETPLRLLDKDDCHGGLVARCEVEGYRAQLFYYWTQDIPLARPAYSPPPACAPLPLRPPPV